jgi:hypothetical protein
MDGWVDEWMDGWMSRQMKTSSSLVFPSHIFKEKHLFVGY